jgi:hypothetical protein
MTARILCGTFPPFPDISDGVIVRVAYLLTLSFYVYPQIIEGSQALADLSVLHHSQGCVRSVNCPKFSSPLLVIYLVTPANLRILMGYLTSVFIYPFVFRVFILPTSSSAILPHFKASFLILSTFSAVPFSVDSTIVIPSASVLL